MTKPTTDEELALWRNGTYRMTGRDNQETIERLIARLDQAEQQLAAIRKAADRVVLEVLADRTGIHWNSGTSEAVTAYARLTGRDAVGVLGRWKLVPKDDA